MKFFGANIFLLAQAVGAVIWGASLSAEVSRLAVLQDKANETASIDLIAFRLDDLTKEIEDMQEMDREMEEIMGQEEEDLGADEDHVFRALLKAPAARHLGGGVFCCVGAGGSGHEDQLEAAVAAESGREGNHEESSWHRNNYNLL